MELSGVLVLLVAGYATANPYGYGTKGGNAATAEAKAVSGAYSGIDDIPVNIPNGAAISGSFSKSSSSSFSSSSASASSSSSSLSFGGSVPIGQISGAVGCNSGNCQGVGLTGAQGSAASESQAYSGTNAASLATGFGGKAPAGHYGNNAATGYQANNANIPSETLASSDCGSSGCESNAAKTSDNSRLQSSNQAKAAASTESGILEGSSENFSACKESGQCESNKCTSEQCGPNRLSDKPTVYDKDIPVSIDTSVFESNNDASNYHDTDKTQSYGSKCSYGNCGVLPSTNSGPSLIVPDQFGGELSPNYASVPSKHFSTPKLESSCNTPNCQNIPNENGYKPSYLLSSQDLSQGYDSHLNNPSYSFANAPYTPQKPGVVCAPGSLSCGNTPSVYTPSDCKSDNCGDSSSSSGYGKSINYQPNSYGNVPAYNLNKMGCIPGTPGCGEIFSSPSSSNCRSGYCGFSTSAGDISKNPNVNLQPPTSLKPSNCAAGTPDCISTPQNQGFSTYNSNSNPGKSPYLINSNNPQSHCNPGTPGCPVQSLVNSPSYTQALPPGSRCTPGTRGCVGIIDINRPDCSSGICNTSPSSGNVNPGYSKIPPSSYSPGKMSITTCIPGTPGCALIPMNKGPSDCAYGNCRSISSSPGNGGAVIIMPSFPYGAMSSDFPTKPLAPAVPFQARCSLGTPGCGMPSLVPSNQVGAGSTPSGYGALATGSSLNNQGSYGSHADGFYNPKSVALLPSSSSPNDLHPSLGFGTEISSVEASKEKKPVYTGGFGGPPGLLKPNEFSAPTSSNKKPVTQNSIATAGNHPTICSSGNCGKPGSTPSHTALGAQASTAASASASAVAYTGGFGGPPGLLKPYDKNELNRVTAKQHPDYSTGKDRHDINSPYPSVGESQVNGNALASATAQASASAFGTPIDNLQTGYDGDYNINKVVGGCGENCEGSSGKSYNGGGNFAAGTGGLGYSHTRDNGSNYGPHTAGAIAKSIASASSGAGAFGFGGSFSSSSAHSSSGVAVKGGYGKR